MKMKDHSVRVRPRKTRKENRTEFLVHTKSIERGREPLLLEMGCHSWPFGFHPLATVHDHCLVGMGALLQEDVVVHKELLFIAAVAKKHEKLL